MMRGKEMEESEMEGMKSWWEHLPVLMELNSWLSTLDRSAIGSFLLIYNQMNHSRYNIDILTVQFHRGDW
jgi:hypothetical protein